MNFHGAACGRKSRHLDLQLIKSEGKPLHIQSSITTGREDVVVLIGFAGNPHGRLHSESGRIDHFHMQFADAGLSVSHESAEQEADTQ